MKIGTRMGDTECGMRAVNRSRRRSRLPAVVRSTKEGPPECDRITTTATITEYEWRGLHRPAPRAGDAISRERERAGTVPDSGGAGIGVVQSLACVWDQ